MHEPNDRNQSEVEENGPALHLETTSARFLMLALFSLAVLVTNAAERTKLWFRDTVSLNLIHSFLIA